MELKGSTSTYIYKNKKGEYKKKGLNSRHIKCAEPESLFLNKLKGLKNDVPEIINVLGDLDYKNEKIIAVVGARRMTSYGRAICKYLAKSLANYPVMIISGLMYGVDIEIHTQALRNNIKCIGVPGYGFDHFEEFIYTHDVIDCMLGEDKGFLVSEFDKAIPPDKWTFPKRNRIIAALADVVVVVEAGQISGSHITVDYALSMGKDVYAFPGSIFSSLSYGCHNLLKQGAYLISHASDLLLGLNLIEEESEAKSNSLDINGNNKFTGEEKAVLKYLMNKYEAGVLEVPKYSMGKDLNKSFSELAVVISSLEIKSVLKSNLGSISLNF